MTLREIADQIGVGEYPEVFEEIYKNLSPDEPACDIDLIHRLQNEHELFGDFYELVCKAAEQLNADPVYSAWVKVNARYGLDYRMTSTPELPDFESKETLITDFLYLFIILPQIPVSINSYRTRGFSEEELKALLSNYRGSIRIVERRTGRPGLDKPYYKWVSHFSRGTLFQTGGFQFDIKEVSNMAIWLRNRQSGQIVPLPLSGTFHASGIKRLGVLGYEDPTGAFTVTFSEDDENYYGHGAYNSVVIPEQRTYPKAEWECIGRPGEICLTMHIPRGADVSREATMNACASAKKILNERFPEYSAKIITTGSWLISPQLKELLGENSRISQFVSCFTTYPGRDLKGTAMFSFVFGKRYENYEDMPEDTTLRRKLKELYLSGHCLDAHFGAIYL